MTHQAAEKAQFFLTAPSPCPYLEGREERKIFTHLNGRRAASLHQLLSAYGFRRSQNLAYRPSCEGCDACKSARVVCAKFAPKKRHRRLRNINRDLHISVEKAIVRDEHYQLFKQYLDHRHSEGGMTGMSLEDFEYMVEDTPVETVLVEYRLPPETPASQPGRLIGVALSDIMSDGFSMVYSFFDPDLSERGLGNYMVLDHIWRAQLLKLPYVYLGYWVEQSPKMRYKSGFKPLEIQEMPAGWRRLD